MTDSTFTLLTNGLMLAVVVCLWLGKRRERRKAIEDACVERARRGLGNMTWER